MWFAIDHLRVTPRPPGGLLSEPAVIRRWGDPTRLVYRRYVAAREFCIPRIGLGILRNGTVDWSGPKAWRAFRRPTNRTFRSASSSSTADHPRTPFLSSRRRPG